MLTPPGIVDLLEITSNYTSIQTGLLYELFLAAGWNKSDEEFNWSLVSVPSDITERFTLLAPLDGFFDIHWNDGDRKRIKTQIWRRHLLDILRNLLLPLPYKREDFFGMSKGRAIELVTVGGMRLNFSANDDTILVRTSSGSASIQVPSMGGTDG
jgi:hypothetical protein